MLLGYTADNFTGATEMAPPVLLPSGERDRALSRRREAPGGDAELDEPELVAMPRSLVEAVVVRAPAGSDELAVEIKVSLSDLVLPDPLLTRSMPAWHQLRICRALAES